MQWLLAIALLIELQGAGGQIIYVNPSQIVNIRKPYGIDQGHWPQGTRCVILTTDGKYFTVVETCEAVRKKLE